MQRHMKCWSSVIVLLFAVACAGCATTSTSEITSVHYPSHWMTNDVEADDCPGTRGLGTSIPIPYYRADATTSDPKLAQVFAGYDDSNIDACRINHVFRGAFRFNLPDAHINKAILYFRATTTYFPSSAYVVEPKSSPYSCAASLQVGEADWTTGSYDYPSGGPIPIASYYPLTAGDLSGHHDDVTHPRGVSIKAVSNVEAGLGSPTGAYFGVDVTSQINEWIAGDDKDNHGFVLVSRNEDLNSGINDTCATRYEGISLEVHTQAIFPVETTSPYKFISTFTPSPPQKVTTPIVSLTTPTATKKPTESPHISINPAQQLGYCANGQYPPVTVQNIGQLPLNWQAQASTTLTITPNQGTLAPSASQTVQFSGSVPAYLSSVVVTFTGNGGTATTTFTCK